MRAGSDTDTVAVVAGGAGLLGSLVVERLQSAVTNVVVMDARASERPHGASTTLMVDLTDERQVKEALATVDELGQVSVLINAQGRSPKQSNGVAPAIEDTTVDELAAVLRDNLASCFLTMREIVPRMAANRSGRVVNVGSTAAHTAHTTASAGYAVAKAGVEVLTAMFARQYGPAGVLVSCVVPGKFANASWAADPGESASYIDEIPLGRIALAGEVADAIAFLSSERNTYVTGTTLIVDGGRLT